jgi:hypothetical protein
MDARRTGGVQSVPADAGRFVKGHEAVCLLACRWFRDGECQAALGGFDESGHCPCRAHEWETPEPDCPRDS